MRLVPSAVKGEARLVNGILTCLYSGILFFIM